MACMFKRWRIPCWRKPYQNCFQENGARRKKEKKSVKHCKIVKSLIQPKDKSMAGACNTTGDEINRHGAISVYFTLVVLANGANTNNSLNTKVASPKIPKPRRYSRGSAKPNTVCDAVLFY